MTTLKITMEAVRQAYPLPVPSGWLVEPYLDDARYADFVNGLKRPYCVGGALCLYLEDTGMLPDKEYTARHFPSAHTVASILTHLNPALDYAGAFLAADAITRQNDAGKFEDAWWHLERALGYTP